MASEISGRRIELVTLTEAAYRQQLATSSMGAAAIDGSISFAAELDSPYLREPSTAVADLTCRPATSVRMLLTANAERLRAAAG